MPHVIHRVGRAIVQRVPFLPESRLTGLLRTLHLPEIEDVEATLRTGERMVVPLREISGFHIYIRGHHQPYVLRHLHEYLRPGMTVLDVGACLGLVTVTCARLVGPSGKVHAFEPGKKQLNYLTKNVALNGFEETVRINPFAVTDVHGFLSYIEGAPHNMGGSHIGAEEGTTMVPSIRLDEYIAEQGIGRVHCVKFDVEGCEMRALKGFTKTMDGPHQPWLVLYECRASTCEQQGHTPADLHGFFLDRGYTVRKARGGRITKRNANAWQWQSDFVATLP